MKKTIDMMKAIAEGVTTNGATPSRDAITFADARQLLNKCANNGHSIFGAESFATDTGCPVHLLEHLGLVCIHESGTGKHGITSGGEAVEELRGVYSLDVLRYLVGLVGFSSDKFGRGSKACDITAHLDDLFKHHAPKEENELYEIWARRQRDRRVQLIAKFGDD